MDLGIVALIISILSFLLGGGIIIRLFVVGKEWGRTVEQLQQASNKANDAYEKSQQIATMLKDLESLSKDIKHLHDDVQCGSMSMENAKAIIHRRIDELNSKFTTDIGNLDRLTASFGTGMHTVTGQIQELLREIGNFLKAEATQKTHGQRLDNIEHDIKGLRDSLSELRGKFSMLEKE